MLITRCAIEVFDGVAESEWLARVMMVVGLPMLADGAGEKKAALKAPNVDDEDDHAEHPRRAG